MNFNVNSGKPFVTGIRTEYYDRYHLRAYCEPTSSDENEHSPLPGVSMPLAIATAITIAVAAVPILYVFISTRYYSLVVAVTK